MTNLKCFTAPLPLYPSLSVIFVEIALTSEMHVTHRYFDVTHPQMTIQPGPVGMVCFSSCHYQGNPPRLRNSFDKWTVWGQSALNFTAQWRAPYSPTRMNQTRFELKESKEGGMRSEKLKMRSQCSLQADRIKWKGEISSLYNLGSHAIITATAGILFLSISHQALSQSVACVAQTVIPVIKRHCIIGICWWPVE